ncbi:ferredoxin [Mycolicibacterium sp. P1-18]|uniref:FAD-dependent oxidoreductase n=1 Tax=Mycolicibacterium sp. P1-18 TaxID=2024615 RepID=UPI0011F3619E|nr:FAD-dependent oxidoreductase [Mycolicibacterium sp. P1-18]KAA0094131.1 ferredoxin [Mycolicibacterium sp. P1-18]
MPHVITRSCCKDESCVAVCPVDCIRPARGEAFTDTAMLFIDARTCIDCGACKDVCPVDAIQLDTDLSGPQKRFEEMSADYFLAHPLHSDFSSEPAPHAAVRSGALRVAIVGAGPAGCYAAAALLESGGVAVSLFERLPTPYGLIRAGVAPDHQDTKSVTRSFEQALGDDALDCYFNVEVGRDVTHAELVADHHAVIYAVGASTPRSLGIPGEGLPGSVAAADVVGWYNGHPDHAHHSFDLTGPRVVIVGNGNVSLDVARVLLLDDRHLTAESDTADHALAPLAHGMVDEVVIVGRRGPRHAAFSVSEFLALGSLPGVDVVVDGDDLAASPDDDVETRWKLQALREFALRPPGRNRKRIVFRFGATPSRIRGTNRVTGLDVTTATGTEVVETSLVIRSIGYRGRPAEDVPFDAAAAVIPNDQGRVLDEHGDPVPGVYVTGWMKRGSSGVIGTNRACAKQTVDRLWSDFDDGRLTVDDSRPFRVRELLAQRGVDALDWSAWQRIDAAEVSAGADARRPRRKITSRSDLVAAGRSTG